MASQPETNSVDTADAEFDKAFAEFAAKKAPDAAPPPAEEPPVPEQGEPEGNAPEPAPSAEEAPKEQASEVGTSGDADGGTPPPAEQQAPDPWAHLPEEAKAELARLQKERDEAQHKAKSDANRVAALSRKLFALEAQRSAPPAPPQPEPESEAKKALDAKIAKLREDYGDVATPLIELMEAQRAELSGKLTNVETVMSNLTEERAAAVIAAETQALEERHPDWREIAASPEFAEWKAVQPPNIQQLASSWDAREASVALTLFRTERAEATGQGPTQQQPETPQQPTPEAAATDARRSQQLEGGAEVRSRPAPAASGPPEDFEAAFKFFSDKRKAQSVR